MYTSYTKEELMVIGSQAPTRANAIVLARLLKRTPEAINKQWEQLYSDSRAIPGAKRSLVKEVQDELGLMPRIQRLNKNKYEKRP